jgi:hypothetical protein
MADRETSQHRAPEAAAGNFSAADIAGDYAFRFSGFTMVYNILYHLSGLGRFRIDAAGSVTGRQRASITPLQGQRAALQKGEYALDGRIAIDPDGIGAATIRFTKTSGEGRDVVGEFHVVVAGTPDRLWLTSAGATTPPSGSPADELVSLEAVRMT